jgi:hypothetical protein
MAGHRANYKQHTAGKFHWIASFELLVFPDAYIELVRIVEYTVRAELLAAEGAMIRENECVNKVQPGRTMAQYRIDHAEIIKTQEAAYRAAHTEDAAAYRAANIEKTNAKHTCNCGGCFTTSGKARHIKTARHQTWLATQ